jgi:hypothetical protein
LLLFDVFDNVELKPNVVADSDAADADDVAVGPTTMPIERSFDLHRKFAQEHLFAVTFIDDVVAKQFMSGSRGFKALEYITKCVLLDKL